MISRRVSSMLLRQAGGQSEPLPLGFAFVGHGIVQMANVAANPVMTEHLEQKKIHFPSAFLGQVMI